MIGIDARFLVASVDSLELPGELMIRKIVWKSLLMVAVAGLQFGCGNVGNGGAPSCGSADVKQTLIEAAMQADSGPGMTVFLWAAGSLESDPEMTRRFQYRNPVSGKVETTTGVQLAPSLPGILGMFNMISGMTGMFEGLANLSGDPKVRDQFAQGTRDSETRIRAFTEDPNVKRVIAALEGAIERGTAALRVTGTRPTRVDDKLRLCDCVAQITWDDGTVLLDGVNYQAQFTTEGQLIVTYIGHD